MSLYLGILIFSFIFTSIAIVPFIDFLYRLRFIRQDERQIITDKDTAAFRKLHDMHTHKVGTPIGGGVLIISVVVFLYALLMPIISRFGVFIRTGFPIKEELNVIFFTFGAFGLLGLYDDIVKIFGFAKTGFFGLRVRHKFLIQIALAGIIALLLHLNLNIDIFYIPFLGVFHLGWMYIPVSMFIILTFTNAFDITDGLDGLSCGVLLICLLALWALSVASLDTPLSVFMALWIGALVAFLYFNVYPARIWLGNAGGLAFGATLAVTGLLLGKVVALAVIGGFFLIEVTSSALQIIWFRLTGKRLFAIAPFHHLLQLRGWEEPKIVMRAWLAAIMLAIFGVWLAQL